MAWGKREWDLAVLKAVNSYGRCKQQWLIASERKDKGAAKHRLKLWWKLTCVFWGSFKIMCLRFKKLPFQKERGQGKRKQANGVPLKEGDLDLDLTEETDPFAGRSDYLFPPPPPPFCISKWVFVLIKGAALTAQREKIRSLCLQWQNKSSTDRNILCIGLSLCLQSIQKRSLLGQEVMQLCYTVQRSHRCQFYHLSAWAQAVAVLRCCFSSPSSPGLWLEKRVCW